MKRFIRDFVALAVLPLCCSLAVGAVLYVDSTPEDGTWVGVYTDLQQALSAVNPGDEIWVAEGVYRPTTGSQRDRSFLLRDLVLKQAKADRVFALGTAGPCERTMAVRLDAKPCGAFRVILVS